MERFCYEQFACFRTVRVRRIDQIHTELNCALQNLERVLPVRRPTPNALPGDAHCAKTEPIDRQIVAQFPSRIRSHACLR